MVIRDFYVKYLKEGLSGPEKRRLRTQYCFSIAVIFIINAYLASDPDNLTLSMALGGFISFYMLIVSFYFGYLGLIVNVLFSLFGMVATFIQWMNTREVLYLSIMTFQGAVIFASFFISYLVEKERSKQRRLEWLSIVDGLTEIYNHRYFQQRLDQELERASRTGNLLALVMVDIDHFKKYNDTLGHKAGDIVLKHTADFLSQNAKVGDLVFRYGGDEFAILITDFDKNKDLERFDRIIKTYGERSIVTRNEPLLYHLTLSMGFAVYPESAGNKEELVKQADNALYLAKNAGRNRLQLYRDTLEEIRGFLTANEQQIVGNLKVLLSAVSVKDRYTLGHSERVFTYVSRISSALGMTAEETKRNQLAALLHDIGKIEIPEAILTKKGQLTEDEMEQIRKHPVYSAIMLEPLEGITGVIPSVRHHHERYDGSGYPDGLSGRIIPLGARILSVADAFDAMLSDRPYRKGMKPQEAAEQLRQGSGTQFDPEIVHVFIQNMDLSGEPQHCMQELRTEP